MTATIRNLVKGETLPERLRTGFEGGNCMPEWIFLAEREGKLVAILVASPAHIVVMILRLIATEEAGPYDVRSLLLEFVETVKARGYGGYMTMVNPENEAEATLGRIIEQTGGLKIPKPQYVCVGAV
jgi:hypothetical protein